MNLPGALQHSVSYRPAGPTLKAFHESPAFVRSVMGPLGSGKSTAAVVELLRRAAQQTPSPDGIRRTRFAIIRNTFGELRTTTINTWSQWCPHEMGEYRETGPITHRVRAEGFDMEVLFLALDREEDARKLLSLELTGAWINEARELPKTVLDTLSGRIGRFPAMRDGGATWSGILLDTNPPDTESWFYKLAEEDTPEGWAFFKQPGGMVKTKDGWQLNPDAENLGALPAGYYTRAAAGKDEDWISVYLGGQYGFVREGKPVFPEYRDQIHCQPCEVAVGASKHWHNPPVIVGADFGLTPAAVIAQRQADGRWLILDELILEDAGVIRFAEALNALLAERYPGHAVSGWGDPAGMARSQTDERTAMQLMTEYTGFPWRPAPSNDPTMRLEAVKAALNRLVDGKPGLVLHPRCATLRKGFVGGYQFGRLAQGSTRYHDRPLKNRFSHPHDALQYLLLGGGEHRVVMRRAQRQAAGGFTEPVYADTRFNPLRAGTHGPRW
jgi:hypothetical protein